MSVPEISPAGSLQEEEKSLWLASPCLTPQFGGVKGQTDDPMLPWETLAFSCPPNPTLGKSLD